MLFSISVISMCEGKMLYSNVSFRKRWRNIIPKVNAQVVIYTSGRIKSPPPINESPKNEVYLNTPPAGSIHRPEDRACL